jgi:hypothetical protein
MFFSRRHSCFSSPPTLPRDTRSQSAVLQYSTNHAKITAKATYDLYEKIAMKVTGFLVTAQKATRAGHVIY